MLVVERVICPPICLVVAMVLAFGTFACDERIQRVEEQEISCKIDLAVPYEVNLLFVGDTARATAVAYDGDGQVISDFEPEWSSSEPSSASVDSTGLITALAPGWPKFRTDSCPCNGSGVRVVGRLDRLQLLPETLAMVPGNTGIVDVHILDSRGYDLYYNFLLEAVRWRSTDAAVLRINPTNSWVSGARLWAIEEGTGHMTVALWDVTDSMFVSVARVDLGAPSSGAAHSCALATDSLGDGLAYCWGHGGHSLGRGMSGAGYVTGIAPVAVIGRRRYAALSAGGDFTCGLMQSGALYCWGDNFLGQLGIEGLRLAEQGEAVMEGTGFAQVSAGRAHSCALALDGAAYCWGLNGFGELGTDSTGETCTIVSPKGKNTPVSCGRVPQLLDTELEFDSVHAGNAISCGLTGDGAIYCWGADYGALPVQVGADRSWMQVALGGIPAGDEASGGGNAPFLACALDNAGTAHCWGNHRFGLGNGSATESQAPVAVAVNATFSSVSVGASACGVTVDGDVYCWSGNDEPPYGGHTPLRLDTDLSFETVSVGSGFTCGLATDGDVYCWGCDQKNLGAHGPTFTTTPVKVEGQK